MKKNAFHHCCLVIVQNQNEVTAFTFESKNRESKKKNLRLEMTEI